MILISLILIICISCTDEKSELDESYIKILDIYPVPGTDISFSDTLVATLEYSVSPDDLSSIGYHINLFFKGSMIWPDNIPLQWSELFNSTQGVRTDSLILAIFSPRIYPRVPVEVKFELCAWRTEEEVGDVGYPIAHTQNVTYQ